MQGTQTGEATWFADGLGACGWTNTSSQYIIAVSELLYDSYPGYDGVNPNTNPVCGQWITASWGGNSVTVEVVDRCVACAETDLDFSEGAFQVMSPLGAGRLDGMTWYWS